MSPLTEPTRLTLAKGQPVPVDLQGFGSVSLLLHGNGTNGSTTITDSSLNPKTVTAIGNTQISTAQSKFGGASILLDGSGDYASASYNQLNDIGNGNWTIEAWIYPLTTAAGERGIVSLSTLSALSGIVLRQAGANLQFWVNGYQTNIVTSTSTVSANLWSHIALVRNGSTNTVFINGSSAGSNSVDPVYGTNTTLAVGRTYTNLDAEYFNGYIDDLRITKGVARYTSNFTPPTAPFPDI